MATEIDWGSIPGLTAKVLKELTKLPYTVGKEVFDKLKAGSLENVLPDQLRKYRSTDQGDASRYAIQGGGSGQVQPTQPGTFAGRPAAIAKGSPDESGTFGAGFVPIETKRSTDKPPEVASQEKRDSPYTKTTALKNSEGNLLTTKGLSTLSDADVTERYTVFFGEKPKNAEIARTELLDLFKTFSKANNPLLD